MDAADQLEAQVKKVIKPLMEARTIAEKAKEIPNLPDYVKQCFTSFAFEIERMIGGVERTSYKWEDNQSKSYTYMKEGTLKLRIADIRKKVPQDALAEAKSQPTLLKVSK